MISSRNIHSSYGRDGLDFANHGTFLEIGDRQILPSSCRTGLPTSISINEQQSRTVSTSFGSFKGGLRIFKHQNVEDSEFPKFIEDLWSFDRSLREPIDIFCSVSAPLNSGLLFAVGTSQGVLTIRSKPSESRPDGPNLNHNSIHVTKISHQRDNFAVEFLKECPDLLLSGGRSGELFLNDLRDTSSKFLVKHPSSITHIKSIDSNHIIVAGLESSLCQYDLRFLKITKVPVVSDSNQALLIASSSSPRSTTRQNKTCTQPIIIYHGYHNNATTGLGFDLDLDSRIIAAAQEIHEGYKPVQLFSLRDGSTLNSLCERVLPANKDSCEDLVRCMRFAQDANTAVKSLYIGRGNMIQRYQWDECPKTQT